MENKGTKEILELQNNLRFLNLNIRGARVIIGKEFELLDEQMLILSSLYQKSNLRQFEICSYTKLSKEAVSTHVGELKRKGLLVKEKSPSCGREVIVNLTLAGKSVAIKITERVDMLFKLMFEDPDRDVASINKLLRKARMLEKTEIELVLSNL